MNPMRSSRTYPHPPEAVFAAFQDPERLARWWGPEGFANEFETFEFRSGGRWILTMVGPDGRRYPNVSEFAEIIPGRRVLVRHLNAPEFVLTIRLDPENGGTHLHWEQDFADPSFPAALAHVLVPANEQNLDRLGRELSRPPSGTSSPGH